MNKSLPAQTVTRREGILSLLGSALALAGCGGGGEAGGSGSVIGTVGSGGTGTIAGVGSGGTGSLSIGAITGFGSIIVNGNGVHIDDSAATMTDADGNALARSALRLGMQVVVVSTTLPDTVTAQSIVVGGQLRGPIEKIVVGKSFDVLGQTVNIFASTAFDSSLTAGLGSLAVNDIVEVHGFLDAKANQVSATYVEKKTGATVFKIMGEVTNLQPAKHTFRIGGFSIDYLAATGTPASGTVMRIELQAIALPGPKDWPATRIRAADNFGQNRDLCEIEARISAFTSASSFSVNGLPVIVSTGATLTDIPVLGLALGDRVQVKGQLVAGVLTATSVKYKSDTELATLEYELSGAVSAFAAANASSGSFTVNGNSVTYDATTIFDAPATPLGMHDGLAITLNGKATGSGSAILASRIRFK